LFSYILGFNDVQRYAEILGFPNAAAEKGCISNCRMRKKSRTLYLQREKKNVILQKSMNSKIEYEQ
jgi:hypothetical protein